MNNQPTNIKLIFPAQSFKFYSIFWTGALLLLVGFLFLGCGGAPFPPDGTGPSGTTTPIVSGVKFTVGGTVTGLTGRGLILRNNNGDNLSVSVNGAFTFATSVTSGSAYSVSVFTKPSFPSQTCSVTNGAGIVTSANIINIAVNCVENTIIPTFTLTVAKTGDGAGTVISSPIGINCETDCTEIYNSDQIVTLTPTAGSNSIFWGWSGEECTGTGTCTVIMTQARNVTAKFMLIPIVQTFPLMVSKSGTGNGTLTSNPVGIACGNICNASFSNGINVSLTAAPDALSTFEGWSAPCSGTDPCVVTITDNVTVKANYVLKVVNKSPLNFSYFKDGQDPNLGSVLSEDQQREGLHLISGYTDWVRGFGTDFGHDKFCGIAKSMGLKVVASAWLGRSLTSNEAEITRIISIANDCRPEIVVVGSEVLLRNDLTEAQLLAYISRVRAAVPPEIPVTTAEIASVLWGHPAVMDAVDVIFANFYPYWEGVNLNVAVQSINADYEFTVKLAKGKQVFVSETGWPSCGEQIGEAVPSLPNAEFYFKNVMSWAKAKKITVFYFEAFDESWKAKPEGPQGACWGLWTKEGVLKPGMLSLIHI